MTSEERFTKIENALNAMADRQAAHDEQLEKNTAGIRDLIRVSGTLLEHQLVLDQKFIETDRKLTALIDTVDRFGRQLNALVDTVDRFVKGLEKNGQH